MVADITHVCKRPVSIIIKYQYQCQGSGTQNYVLNQTAYHKMQKHSKKIVNSQKFP